VAAPASSVLVLAMVDQLRAELGIRRHPGWGVFRSDGRAPTFAYISLTRPETT